MSLGTTISRVTGFLRVAALASVLGLTASSIADSFNLANITPNIVYDLILGGILASLFIPIFVEYLHSKGEEEAWHVANSVLNLSIIILTGVALLLCILAPLVIKSQTFLTGGTRSKMEADAIFLLRFFIFEIIFYGFCAVFTGILNSYKHFTIPAFAPIVNNVIVIATVIIYYFVDNLLVLAIGATLGVVSMAMIQLPWVRRTGFRYRPIIDLKHPGVRKLGRLALPVLGYVVINQVGLWVVNILALKVEGGISAYSYAYIFFQLPYGILAVSIITALFPTLSEQAVKKADKDFLRSTSLGIRITSFVIIPASVGYLVLNVPIVRLLLERLRFGKGDTIMVAAVLFYFVIGLIFFALFMLMVRVFYSMQDTFTPMIIAGVTIVLNIALDIFYFNMMKAPHMKIAGLALGSSTAYFVGAIIVGIVLRYRIGSLDGARIFRSLSKVVIASGIMGVACYGTARLVKSLVGVERLGGQLLQVVSAVGVGAVVYLLFMWLLRSEEMHDLWRLLRRLKYRSSPDIVPEVMDVVEEDTRLE